MSKNVKNRITVAIVGLECVGKTAFIEKLHNPKFDIHTTLSTISFNMRSIIVNNDIIGNTEVELIDISPIAIGHMTHFVNDKDCIILMYDLCNRKSFDYLAQILVMLKSKPHDEQLFYLIGTKSDICDVKYDTIPDDEIDTFMCENNIKYFTKIQSSHYDKLKCDFDALVLIMCKDIIISRPMWKHTPVLNNIDRIEDIQIYNERNINMSDMYNCCSIS